jgi:membrane-bound lytic murein transglycosylase D
VQRGDTLSRIAAEYRVSLAALMRVNGMTNRSMIRVGQMIRLPTDDATAPPDATLVRAEAPSSAAAAPVVTPTLASTSAEGVYVVRRGDSIERIASRLGVDAQALIAANDIRNRNVIQIGQQLIIPTAPGAVVAMAAAVTQPSPVSESPVVAPSESPAAIAAAPAASADVTAALAPAVLENGLPAPGIEAEDDEEAVAEVNALEIEQDVLAADPSDYSVSATNEISVQALETLGHYADWLEIPTQRLRDINSLSFREAVVLGQNLTLDFTRVDAPSFEQRRRAYHQQIQSDFFAAYQIEEIESHVMRPGESLWILAARRYNVPVWLLRQYNPDLDFDRIPAGAVVRFPRLKAIAADNAVAAPQVLADN